MIVAHHCDSIVAPITRWMDHDPVMIGPRSCDDRATIARRSSHDRVTIEPRSRDDRAMIARRSGHDPWRLSHDRLDLYPSSDPSQVSMHLDEDHDHDPRRSNRDKDQTLPTPPSVSIWVIDLCHLNVHLRTCSDGDRVGSVPRDWRLAIGADASNSPCHLQKKNPREHCPT